MSPLQPVDNSRGLTAETPSSPVARSPRSPHDPQDPQPSRPSRPAALATPQPSDSISFITMVFERPASLPLPTVWRRFSAHGAALRVQDLAPEQLEDAVRLLATHFTADEPPCKYIEIHKHPGALRELEALWRGALRARLSLVCVEDRDDATEIVAVNVLTVVSKTDNDEPFQTDDPIWAQLFGAVDLVGRSVDIFERFGVEQYLTAYGLVVAPRWRGAGIGKEMLLARVPLCKALGVRVTATVFTAAASQAVAARAGFQLLHEVSYEELAERGFRFPGVQRDTKSSKLMALVVE